MTRWHAMKPPTMVSASALQPQMSARLIACASVTACSPASNCSNATASCCVRLVQVQLQRSVQAAAELAATGHQEPHAPTLQLLEQPSELQRLHLRTCVRFGQFAFSCPGARSVVCSCSAALSLSGTEPDLTAHPMPSV